MTRKIVLAIGTLCAVVALAGISVAGEKDEHAATKTDAAKETTMTGEVLDLTCYASHPETGSGPDHASCAKTCIDKGLPVGLLVDGVIYLPVMKNHTSPNKAFGEYAGKIVTVTGTPQDVAGSHFIVVSAVAAAVPEKKG